LYTNIQPTELFLLHMIVSHRLEVEA